MSRVARYVGPVCDRYFRSEVRGLARVPQGPTLLVGNHDGGNLPVDGICFALAWHRHFGWQRPLRVLMHDIPFKLFGGLTRLLHDVGCVPASPHRFEAGVAAGESMLLYPGAARESFRPYSRRRDVDLGGRSGFVARALRSGLPVTPVVSVGAHETMFVLHDGRWLARAMRIDKYFRADVWPLVAGLPFGIWLGPFFPQLPLPAKITVEVQEPIRLAEALAEELQRPIGPADAEDREVVQAGFRLVQSVMQGALRRLYAERRYPVIG